MVGGDTDWISVSSSWFFGEEVENPLVERLFFNSSITCVVIFLAKRQTVTWVYQTVSMLPLGLLSETNRSVRTRSFAKLGTCAELAGTAALKQGSHCG